MTTATQVLALIDSAMEGDMERFRAVSLQVAADASQRGRASFHDSILARLNKRRARRHPTTPELHGVTLAGLPFHSIADGDAVPQELRGALEMSYPDRGAATMTLAPDVRVAMEGLVREREMTDDLRAVGLQPATRVMFSGPPGTGKSTGAAALAADLGWPLLSVKMHGVIRQHLGETAAMLADDVTGDTALAYDRAIDAVGGALVVLSDNMLRDGRGPETRPIRRVYSRREAALMAHAALSGWLRAVAEAPIGREGCRRRELPAEATAAMYRAAYLVGDCVMRDDAGRSPLSLARSAVGIVRERITNLARATTR